MTTRIPSTARRSPRAPTVRAECSLSLLGDFELRVGERTASIPLSAQRVLAFLALRRSRLTRICVAGHLWADATEVQATAALRTALWRLGQSAGPVVRRNGQSLYLDPALEIDVDVATAIAREVLQGGAAVSPHALAGLRDDGELLPDWYDDWVLIERERYRQLRLHALEALCRRLTSDGRHAEATEAGVAAVAGEPLRESAHDALIAAYLAERNHGEALRQYRLCRSLLRRELGLEPSPQLAARVAHLSA